MIGLGITAAVAIPVALVMQLDNPGPIFYSQTRCGLYGRCFRIWKFRSMMVGAEQLQHLVLNEASGQIFKNANDPRVTRIGRFLRHTSLDELPQFWNVLKGEMSHDPFLVEGAEGGGVGGVAHRRHRDRGCGHGPSVSRHIKCCPRPIRQDR